MSEAARRRHPQDGTRFCLVARAVGRVDPYRWIERTARLRRNPFREDDIVAKKKKAAKKKAGAKKKSTKKKSRK